MPWFRLPKSGAPFWRPVGLPGLVPVADPEDVEPEPASAPESLATEPEAPEKAADAPETGATPAKKPSATSKKDH